MSTVEFSCPRCNATLRSKPASSVKCPKCQHSFSLAIPRPTAVAVAQDRPFRNHPLVLVFRAILILVGLTILFVVFLGGISAVLRNNEQAREADAKRRVNEAAQAIDQIFKQMDEKQ